MCFLNVKASYRSFRWVYLRIDAFYIFYSVIVWYNWVSMQNLWWWNEQLHVRFKTIHHLILGCFGHYLLVFPPILFRYCRFSLSLSRCVCLWVLLCVCSILSLLSLKPCLSGAGIISTCLCDWHNSCLIKNLCSVNCDSRLCLTDQQIA